jgi:hypothetical protein
MEKHKEHADELANNDDVRLDSDHECAQAFKNDFEKLIENVKPEPRRDVNGFIAMMNFVKAPEMFRFVTEEVPDIDSEVEQHKTKSPFEGTVWKVP